MATIVNRSASGHSPLSNITVYGGEGTASTGLTRIDWQNNTGDEYPIGFTRSNQFARSPYNNNRQFIRLYETFNSALKKMPKLTEEQTLYSLLEKMKFSSNLLLKFNPDRISLQLTDDGAIYYTLLINNITLYVSQYLNADVEGIDEFLVSVFLGEENLLNATGNMNEILYSLNKTLTKHNITIPELA